MGRIRAAERALRDDAAMIIDWGSVPSWLALAGGVTAAWSYRSSRRDAIRREASRVYIEPGKGSLHAGADDGYFNCTVRNDGETSIFEVRLAYWYPGRRRLFWRLRRYDHRMTGTREPGRLIPNVRPRGASCEQRFGMLKMSSSTYRQLSTPVTIIFRDGNGRHWIRWPDGKLHRFPSWARFLHCDRRPD